MRIAFIINSKIQRLRQRVSSITACFSAFDGTSEYLETQHRGHAIELAKEIGPLVDVVVSVGGDGTLSEVVNGLMLIPRDHRPLLGLLPAGSANDFARTVNILPQPGALREYIEMEFVKSVDVGEMRFSGGKTKYFINIADVGIGPEVVQRVERGRPSLKYLNPELRFMLAAVITFIKFRKKEVVVEIGSTRISGPKLAVIAANGKAFGGGQIIAPEADPCDGVFQVVIAGNLSTLQYISQLPRIKKGHRIDMPEIGYYSTPNLKISSPDRLRVEADGELSLEAPVELWCLPGEIKLLCPLDPMTYQPA